MTPDRARRFLAGCFDEMAELFDVIHRSPVRSTRTDLVTRLRNAAIGPQRGARSAIASAGYALHEDGSLTLEEATWLEEFVQVPEPLPRAAVRVTVASPDDLDGAELAAKLGLEVNTAWRMGDSASLGVLT